LKVPTFPQPLYEATVKENAENVEVITVEVMPFSSKKAPFFSNTQYFFSDRLLILKLSPALLTQFYQGIWTNSK